MTKLKEKATDRTVKKNGKAVVKAAKAGKPAKEVVKPTFGEVLSDKVWQQVLKDAKEEVEKLFRVVMKHSNCSREDRIDLENLIETTTNIGYGLVRGAFNYKPLTPVLAIHMVEAKAMCGMLGFLRFGDHFGHMYAEKMDVLRRSVAKTAKKKAHETAKKAKKPVSNVKKVRPGV